MSRSSWSGRDTSGAHRPRREDETRAALLARLRDEVANDGWVMVAQLAREGLMGASGFPDAGVLGRLCDEGLVASCRRGRAWAVRAVPAVLGPLVVAPDARGACGDVVDLDDDDIDAPVVLPLRRYRVWVQRTSLERHVSATSPGAAIAEAAAGWGGALGRGGSIEWREVTPC